MEVLVESSPVFLFVMFWLAVGAWWLTGSPWPILPAWIAIYVTIHMILFGELAQDGWDTAKSMALAAAVAIVPCYARHCYRERQARRLHGARMR